MYSDRMESKSLPIKHYTIFCEICRLQESQNLLTGSDFQHLALNNLGKNKFSAFNWISALFVKQICHMAL